MICDQCGSEHVHKNGFDREGRQRFRCAQCRAVVHCDVENADIIKKNVRLAKDKQKLMDQRRIDNASFRKYAQVENAVSEYVKEIRDWIKKVEFPYVKRLKNVGSKKEMVIQLSDLHFNELVEIFGNTYDFRIASKRLYKFASRIIEYIHTHKITKVHIVMTGDLLNSDRRTDELLSNATNRAKATILSSKLLSQFISLLSNYSNINVLSISGNESRINAEHTFIDSLATDNFDFMIYEIMKLLFRRNKRVKFIHGGTYEHVYTINGTNFLLIHGDTLGKMTNTDLSKTITKWAKKGVIIHFVLCGHLHEAMITDTMARSSSLVGGNDYSDHGLGLYSRSSQNLHLVYKDGSIDSIKIDLQNIIDSDPMFDIDDDLAAYNAKSVTKLNKHEKIIRADY